MVRDVIDVMQMKSANNEKNWDSLGQDEPNCRYAMV